MAEEQENNVGDNLEIPDSQGKDGANEGDSQSEETTESAAGQNKIKAIIGTFESHLQPFLQMLKENKVLMIGVIAIFALIVVFLILIIVLLLSKNTSQEKPEPAPISRKIVEPAPILGASKRPEVDDTELGNMLKKANLLYTQGDKMEALNLFENIAVYSQSIAYYNLGVIEVKEGEDRKSVV